MAKTEKAKETKPKKKPVSQSKSPPAGKPSVEPKTKALKKPEVKTPDAPVVQEKKAAPDTRSPVDRTRPLSLSEIKDLQKKEVIQQAVKKEAAVPAKAAEAHARQPSRIEAIHAEPKREAAKPALKPVLPAAPQAAPRAPFSPRSPIGAPAAHDIRSTAVSSSVPAETKISAPKVLQIRSAISVKDLAVMLQVRPTDLITRLIKLGIFANINQSINFETASKLVVDFGIKLEKFDEPEEAPQTAASSAAPRADAAQLVTRPAIVTFMGHVDHGKTSLLDAIRKTRVAAGEAGGITQHIGAYEVVIDRGSITFLDTPGHEAFTEMRARGAKATDIVVLVVAADDGIMPQTEEAIDHAKAADATIVVAINKVDLPSANVERVKKELAEHNLLPEDWGGKTICVPVSAKTGAGISQLLEMLVLESELLELKANPGASPAGVVIEAQLSKGSGPVATVLMQEGTLRIGDVVVCGNFYGKVRSMTNDRGDRVREATPSKPVEIAGLSGVPRAGERFTVVDSEPKAREIVEARARRAAEAADGQGHITLEEIYSEIRSGNIKALKLVLKSDVQGSVEALRGTLQQIPTKDVQLQIIHTGIGNITRSDVMLAAASNAIVIGFHVDTEPDAQDAVRAERVDVRLYEIIYEVRSAIEKAMSGLLAPEIKEIALGSAEIRQLFKISKVGMIAGSMVTKGKIVRNASCRVLRGGKKIFEGKISGLKRFKDDVREVQEGFECGISVSSFKDLMEGDRIEVFEMQSKQPTEIS